MRSLNIHSFPRVVPQTGSLSCLNSHVGNLILATFPRRIMHLSTFLREFVVLVCNIRSVSYFIIDPLL